LIMMPASPVVKKSEEYYLLFLIKLDIL
jgi:hypothetical protein